MASVPMRPREEEAGGAGNGSGGSENCRSDQRGRESDHIQEKETNNYIEDNGNQVSKGQRRIYKDGNRD